MTFNKYHIHLLLRLICILASMMILTISIIWWKLIFLSISLVVIIGVQIHYLFKNLTASTRAFEKFVGSINSKDYTAGFQLKDFGGAQERLENSMKEVLNKLKENAHFQEGNYLILNKLVEHLPHGIIVRKNNELLVMNSEAMRLLESPRFQVWDRLSGKHPFLLEEDPHQLQIKSSTFNKNLRIQRSSLSVKSNHLTIFTLSNVEQLITESEVNSYEKLNKILSHEIQNSVSPIVSLSQLANEKLNDLDHPELKEIIEVIMQKSEGLKEFVNRFRTLNQIPQPITKETSIEKLLTHIQKLMESELSSSQSISVNVQPKSLEIILDTNQIELCIINLIKNSMEAQGTNPSLDINLTAYRRNGESVIEVSDNGSGIPDSIQDLILVPFYTSKPTGSGIGLSLVNQIMAQHMGRLQFRSSSQGSSFYLHFSE